MLLRQLGQALRLVQHGPEGTDVADGLEELTVTNWLNHESVHPEAVAPDQILFLAG